MTPSVLGVAAEPAVIAESSRSDFRVLGVRVDALQIPDVVERMWGWIVRREAGHYIAVTGMHGVMEAQHDHQFKQGIAEADLVVPDGMPLVWIARLRGHDLRRRVYGPELLETFCRQTAASGCRHFLCGGEPGVPEQLAAFLKRCCPDIQIAGTYSPPFGPLSTEEEAAMVQAINNSAADVLWVGLGTPKQELWMTQYCRVLRVPVMVGVGAAFDFLADRKKQAPGWMRERGLEWLFRLVQEPRRLWRRYLISGAQFVFLVTLELLRVRRFD